MAHNLHRSRSRTSATGQFETSSDVSPTVECHECKNWYTMSCVGMSDVDAQDTAIFVCASCVQLTGRRTMMFWDISQRISFKTEMHSPYGDDADDAFHEGSVDDEGSRQLSPEGQGAHSDEYMSDREFTDIPFAGRKRKGRLSRRLRDGPSSGQERAVHADLQGADQSSGREAGIPQDDPVRKYCHGKLVEVISPIFQEYASKSEGDNYVREARSFVDQLEWYLFDTYAELDERKGRRVAAAKYRERFRTLNFNLAQKDRTVLRRRIGAGGLPASELSKLSSADLANEQRQQEIENARRESLQHSILEARAAPTVKITHKGEEVIESLSDEFTRRPEKPSASSEAEATEKHVADGLSMEQPLSPIPRPSTGAVSQLPMGLNEETEMDGIIDLSPVIQQYAEIQDRGSLNRESVSESPGSPVQGLERPPTSPVAPRSPPLWMPTQAFDLNSLWSQSDLHDTALPGPLTDDPDVMVDDGLVADNDELGVTDGQDFAEFLGLDLDRGSTPVSEDQPLLDHMEIPSSPVVWSGELIMPMDPAPPLACPVAAVQIGGPELESNPAVWRNLFTSPSVRIDGRVPILSSTQYLLTMRMSASKELVVVAISPAAGSDGQQFAQLIDFLHSRSRHALVFPWGAKPPETAPGKDLYLVPLKSTDPIPEYIQLLDRLQLPIVRTADILLAVFVLYKARLPRSIVSTPYHPMSPAEATAQRAMFQPIPSSIQQVLPTSGIDPSALATLSNDLASLSPEQLQLVQSLLGVPTVGGSGQLSDLAKPHSRPIVPHPSTYMTVGNSMIPGNSVSLGHQAWPAPQPREASHFKSAQSDQGPKDGPWNTDHYPTEARRTPYGRGIPSREMSRSRPKQSSGDSRDFDQRPRDAGWAGRGRGGGNRGRL